MRWLLVLRVAGLLTSVVATVEFAATGSIAVEAALKPLLSGSHLLMLNVE